MIMRIEAGGRDWVLELRTDPDKEGSWEVSTQGGTHIGRVFKSEYTYSPPTHRGSRIAKYHKSVKCWRMEEGPMLYGYASGSGFGHDRYSHGPYQTRKAALSDMMREHLARLGEEKKVASFARRHPTARFRLSGDDYLGEVLRRHPGGLVLRDASKPRDSREVRVRRRQIREDHGSVLQVQLRPRGRWEAIANAMYEEEE